MKKQFKVLSKEVSNKVVCGSSDKDKKKKGSGLTGFAIREGGRTVGAGQVTEILE